MTDTNQLIEQTRVFLNKSGGGTGYGGGKEAMICLTKDEHDERNAKLHELCNALEAQQHLVERLKREAEAHALEARAQRATVHKCYQAVTGYNGEPGDWNGARPIKEFVEAQQKRTDELEEALMATADNLHVVMNSNPRYSAGTIDKALRIARAALPGKGGADAS